MQCTSPMRIKNPDRFKFKKPFENVGSEWLEVPCAIDYNNLSVCEYTV